MPVPSSEKEQKTDGSQTCECGKGMCECSIHPSTPEKWIASMRDSLARICLSPGIKLALAKRHDPAFTGKLSVSLALFDPATSSLKTCQQSLDSDSNTSWPTWPRWGSMRNGVVYEHPIAAHPIRETGGGYLPTPTSSEPQLERRAKHGNHFQTQTGSIRRKNENGTSSFLGLAGYVRMFPTPTARDYKGGGKAVTRKDGKSRMDMLDWLVESQEPNGRLNPDWVSWLMGFPIGFAKVEKK